MEYGDFLKTKQNKKIECGFNINEARISDKLYPFQKDITKWALKKGRASVFADCGLGKGQKIGSAILTVDGFKRNDELKHEEMICSSNGEFYPLTGIYERGIQDTYEIHFTDKSSIIVDGEHLHILRTNNDRQRGKPWRILDTNELLESNLRYGKNGKSRNYDIPIVKPIKWDEPFFIPIPPYTLGVLLGGGCIIQGSMSFTTEDTEIVEAVQREMGDKYRIVLFNQNNYRVSYCRNKNNPLIEYLRELGLLGKYSYEKFMPDIYLRADIETRLNLLRGLMDTDGYIGTTSEFYTTSDRLSDNVLFLIRSLGGIPTHKRKRTHYKKNGKRIECKKINIITFSLKTYNPFKLKRKAEKWNENPRDNGRWIDRMEYAGKQETICLSVASPDQSYITENFIVTHNTPIQLEWARHIFAQTGDNILIFAPLAVNRQTQEEGEKFSIPVNACRDQSDVKPGINITNYEMMHHFDYTKFSGIVLDESSILKGFGGKYRKELNIFAENIPYRLCCTATPAPNDYIELINHAEFLSIMREKEMKAMFFTVEGNNVHKWRLKGHAVKNFWEWMSTWSVAIRKPSDIGFDDDGFILPPIKFYKTQVISKAPEEYLFAIEAQTLNDQRKVQRESLPRRLEKIVKLRNETEGQLLIWTHFNYESHDIHKAIPGSIEVKGSDTVEHKESALLGFKSGKIQTLITKPSIAGFGMNFQSCHNMVFASLSNSYEQFYQATRRCWRFGQKEQVNVNIITSEAENKIVQNIIRKEKQVAEMMDKIIEQMGDYNMKNGNGTMNYETKYAEGKSYQLHLGDSVELIDEIPDESIDLTIFSPPFPGMYAYTNSERDIGNSTNQNQLMEHFGYLMQKDKLYRVMIPGRMVAIHITQEPAFKGKDGFMGLKDYRGNIISTMVNNGWIYYGEVTIDKDPQLKAQRTKDLGLLFKTLAKDSALLRMAMADYLIYFRKPGDNPKAIKAGTTQKYNSKGWVNEQEWIEWAAPVWYRKTKNYPGGIRETEVLNTKRAKGSKDEKHICPLQLGVIHRAVYLWSAPGETVFSPFAGIGSEGYQSILDGRKFIGIELKREYYDTAIRNLEDAQRMYRDSQSELFD